MSEEHDLQKLILKDLAYFQLFHYRQNTGRRGGVSYGKKGASDIVVVINGIYIGIEVKAKGKDLSKDQKDFKRDLIENGGQYHKIDNYYDWTCLLTESLLPAKAKKYIDKSFAPD